MLQPVRLVPNAPGPENRITILGRTGSGKTTAGVFWLSLANFDEMPWTIIDSKRDKEIAALDATWLTPGDAPPIKPGLYVYPISPGDQSDIDALEAYLHAVHAQGNHGVFVDEGYSVYPVRRRGALTNIFTQGRSLRIPVIFNSQRPSGVGVEALSEASFIQVFDLTRLDDRKKAQEYVPQDAADFVNTEIGRFKSDYHEVGSNVSIRMKPVQSADLSIARINAKLAEIRRRQQELRQIDAGAEKGSTQAIVARVKRI